MSGSAFYPNNTLREPDVSTDWMGYPGHYGCDYINFDYNFAVLPGVVTYAGYNPSGAGNEVKVDHGIIDGDHIETRYLHNAKVLVEVGGLVTRGFALGVQGATGNATGKHLHFEVIVNGVKVSPRPWLRAHLGSAAMLNVTPITKKKVLMSDILYRTYVPTAADLKADKTVKGIEYYLIDPIFPGGFYMTSDQSIADGFSQVTSNGGYMTLKQRNALKKAAPLVYAAFWAAEAEKARLYATASK